jgi:hypothetical protein
MMKPINKENVSKRELRQFGLGLGVLLCLVAGALLWNGHRFGFLFVLAGALLAVAFWCDWPGIRSFYVAWMKLAMIMARIMTTLLLTLMYVLVLTPIALLGRLCGQKFVERGFREERDSYWETCARSKGRRSCEKQS